MGPLSIPIAVFLTWFTGELSYARKFEDVNGNAFFLYIERESLRVVFFVYKNTVRAKGNSTIMSSHFLSLHQITPEKRFVVMLCRPTTTPQNPRGGVSTKWWSSSSCGGGGVLANPRRRETTCSSSRQSRRRPPSKTPPRAQSRADDDDDNVDVDAVVFEPIIDDGGGGSLKEDHHRRRPKRK